MWSVFAEPWAPVRSGNEHLALGLMPALHSWALEDTGNRVPCPPPGTGGHWERLPCDRLRVMLPQRVLAQEPGNVCEKSHFFRKLEVRSVGYVCKTFL